MTIDDTSILATDPVHSKKVIRLQALFFLAILIVGIFLSVKYSEEKTSYHIDENASYFQSNGDGIFAPFTEKNPPMLNKVIPSDDFFSYMSVADKDRFDYLTVYRENKHNHAHPPLYFLALHTVLSLFPDSFSMSYALTLNIVLMALSLLVLFFLGRMSIRNPWLALLPCLIWALSPCYTDTAIFARMYALQTLFAVCYILFIFRIIVYGATWKRSAAAAAFLFLGVTTQYYSLIPGAIISFLLLLYLLFFKERRKEILPQLITLVAAAVLAIVLMPTAISDLLHGKRGKEALSTMSAGKSDGTVLSYAMKWVSSFAWSNIAVIGIIIAVAAICLLLILFIRKKTGDRRHAVAVLILSFGAFSSYMLIAKLAPYDRVSYVAFLFPCLILSFIMALDLIIIALVKNENAKRKTGTVTALIITVCIACTAPLAIPSQLTFSTFGVKEIMDYLAPYNGYNALVVGTPSEIRKNYPLFTKMDYNYITKTSNPAMPNRDYLTKSEGIILFVDNEDPAHKQEIIENIRTVFDPVYIEEMSFPDGKRAFQSDVYILKGA